ncbi:hypothetical protein [Rubrivirga litoralis]|uniref:Restriction endonuclease n=1 Tax=Rubrivirga litoralis TaxID=3075598 RepID=A0ABU3BQG1_9BACT|nr:hypothetical protein [Rubrivirga sp. F394]MDT0631431.1 hypothetical protein [Rubrivirga sp. F394]
MIDLSHNRPSMHTPPTRGLLPHLDFFQLTADAFEELCLDLVLDEGEVERAVRYGVKGDYQDGIDILAVLEWGKQRAYQCKREKRFGPAKIREAVSLFLDHGLADSVEAFVLCTAERLNSRQRLNALTEAGERLGEVRFEVWDQAELSRRLRNRRDLVARAFGESWAEAFNGTVTGWDRAHGIETRYLVCMSSDVTFDIAAGRLDGTPFEDGTLFLSPAGRYQSALARALGSEGRRESEYGRGFRSANAYQRAHPDAKVEPWGGEHPTFTRTPSATEVQKHFKDPITRSFLDAGVRLDRLAQVTTQFEYCGSGRFEESHAVAPLWSLHLQITNRSAEAVHLDRLRGSGRSGRNQPYEALEPGVGQSLEAVGPGSALAPGQTLLVPLATLVIPYTASGVDHGHDWDEIGDRLWFDSFADLSEQLAEAWVIGPTFWPEEMSIQSLDGDSTAEIAVRAFEPRRIGILDVEWGFGSCPHLFVELNDGVQYVRPLFTAVPGAECTEHALAPPGAVAFLLAELEHETTYLTSVFIDGQPMPAPPLLRRGDRLRMPVSPGSDAVFVGHYEAARTAYRPELARRLISAFVGHAHQSASAELDRTDRPFGPVVS